MKQNKEFKVGDSVIYTNPFNRVQEFGWVKRIIDDDPNNVFVVYASKGDDFINESNYKNFIAHKTPIKFLIKV